MTLYEQQVEAGKAILQQIVRAISAEFSERNLASVEFHVTDDDFDYNRVSLVDRRNHRIIMKVDETDLADCPADASVRGLLEAQLRVALLRRQP